MLPKSGQREESESDSNGDGGGVKVDIDRIQKVERAGHMKEVSAERERKCARRERQ